MSSEQQVRADLDYLVDAWPHLVTLKVPGPAAHWQDTPPRHTTVEVDAERPGERGIARPVPVDVNVLDLLTAVVHATGEVVAVTRDLLALRRGFTTAPLTATSPPPPIAVDPRPWLTWARAWLSAAQEENELTVPWVAEQVGPVAALAARLLGDVRSGQYLRGLCPFCLGVTPETPAGGERTLHVLQPSTYGPAEQDAAPVIVCNGPTCTPPPSMCGHRVDGRPAWPEHEWAWLSPLLLAEPTTVRTPLRQHHPRPTYERGPDPRPEGARA